MHFKRSNSDEEPSGLRGPLATAAHLRASFWDLLMQDPNELCLAVPKLAMRTA